MHITFVLKIEEQQKRKKNKKDVSTYLKKRIQTNLRLADVVGNAVFR